MTKDFIIADFRIRLEGGNWASAAGHFGRALKVFEVPCDPAAACVLILKGDAEGSPAGEEFRTLDEFDFAEVNALCRFARSDGEWLFTMTPEGGGTPLWFRRRCDSPEVCSNLDACCHWPEFPSLFRFGLWMMFGIAITPLHAIAIHSSTIRCDGGAALFLGESGTGKSTHTRLWREHIPGAELLNDDSPVIRLTGGVATVYGSPWSGKTPCYRNEKWPIRGLVRLSQAPHNRMARLSVVRAIGALLPSCPPAFAFDNTLQDDICETLSQIISRVPVYHLECLPDAAAAELSYHTLFDDHAAQR